MKKLARYVTIISFLVLPLITGCGGSSGGGGGSSDTDGGGATGGTGGTGDGNVNVVLNLDFSALSSGGSQSQSPGFVKPMASGIVYDGTVTFEPVGGGDNSTFAIKVDLDDNFDAIVSQTLNLAPGQYDVSVIFSGSGLEYYGRTELANRVTITAGSTIPVNIEVNPVIGDSVVSVSHTDIPLYDFAYDSSYFGSGYRMHVVIGGTDYGELEYDSFTEAAEVWINIPDGSHDVLIEITDGGVAIARYQSSSQITFSAGQDQTFNLTPIFGRATFALTEAGGDATFDIQVLTSTYDDIVTETGGSFEIRFKGTGAEHNTIPEEVLTLTQNVGEGRWETTRTYSGFQFETMTCEIEVWEIADPTSDNEQIGNCTFPISLTAAGSSDATCDLNLKRRSQISGTAYQVLGINVVDATGDAAPENSIVYVNGSPAALTGGTGVTTGYTTIFLTPDASHDIFATSPTGDGTSDVTRYAAEALKIDNILLELK